MRQDRQLILENGRRFFGTGFGAEVDIGAELVFHTVMAGYQEVLSDPARCGQLVMMTYPLIGNCGLADEDYEAAKPALSGLVVREYNSLPSNYRWTRTLEDWLMESGVPGIAGVDTRAVMLAIRGQGSVRALLIDADVSVADGLKRLAEMPIPRDLVSRVSCKKPWYARTANPKATVVAIDLGIRMSLVRRINELGMNVAVVPHSWTAEQIMAMRPDGVLFSDGPGDPKDCASVIYIAKTLMGKLPMLGIGLGQLVVALAAGADTFRMKTAHFGSNHPVRDLLTGKTEMVLQGHCFCVDRGSVSGTALAVTQEDLTDGAVEGLASIDQMIFTAQYQPEAGVVAQFIAAIGERGEGRSHA